MDRWHKPIFLNEVIENIGIRPEAQYLDLTFGEGGHSDAMVDAGAGQVTGVDRDWETLERYRQDGKYKTDPRLVLRHSLYSRLLQELPENSVDGILMDLGVSTRQLLEPERGFTFQSAGPLDMRMDKTSGPTLSEKLEAVSESELAEILHDFADVKGARSAASRILATHRRGELTTTENLARLFGQKRPGEKRHPATQAFLALRMWVNDEMGEVKRSIPEAVRVLRAGGRLAVITFHSVEDRIVKRMFRQLCGECVCEEMVCLCARETLMHHILRKPLSPTEAEVSANARARSAKLRCIEKIPPSL